MKKIVLLLMSVIFVLLSFSGCNIFKNDETAKPNPASDFEFEVNPVQTGILIHKYIGSDKSVVIPSEINGLPVISLNGVPNINYPTAVDSGVFEGSNIKTVVIPETVKVIGFSAFKNCKELTKVTISENTSLTFIMGSAFMNCEKLEKIDLSATQIKWIESVAFQGCSNLKEIAFPDTLEKIGEKAFYNCSALSEVNLPKNLTQIDSAAFAYCTSLERVVIPEKLSLISLNEAILHNVPSLKQIVFEEGREVISGYAFLQTDKSVEIIIPKSVKKFSPLPFLINPSADITVTFLGDAPEIENEDAEWFGNPIIQYYSETNGWDSFAWKDKFEMKQIEDY